MRASCGGSRGQRRLLVGVTGLDSVRRLCRALFDPAEFLSPHGLRSLSAYHREHPYVLDVEGVRAGIDYEPAESTTAMFGGNSNWRGPVWFPLELSCCDRVAALPRILRRRAHGRIPDWIGKQGHSRCRGRRLLGTSRVDLSRRRQRTTALLRRRASGCRTTGAGVTTCCSTSTSTATTAPASARLTRRGGRGWSPT